MWVSSCNCLHACYTYAYRSNQTLHPTAHIYMHTYNIVLKYAYVYYNISTSNAQMTLSTCIHGHLYNIIMWKLLLTHTYIFRRHIYLLNYIILSYRSTHNTCMLHTLTLKYYMHMMFRMHCSKSIIALILFPC